jgi:hypothetical protein
MVEDFQVAKRPEVVLAETSKLVLEVAPLPFERRVLVELDALSVDWDPQKLEAADHPGAVTSFVSVAERPCVTDCDQREETLRSSKYAAEFVEGVVRVAAFEGPEEPGMEGIVTRPVRDVRDPGKKLGVERCARRLSA